MCAAGSYLLLNYVFIVYFSSPDLITPLYWEPSAPILFISHHLVWLTGAMPPMKE